MSQVSSHDCAHQSVPPFQEFPLEADHTFLDDMNLYAITEPQVGARVFFPSVFDIVRGDIPGYHRSINPPTEKIPIKINKTGFRVLAITPKDICAVTAASGLDS